MKFLIVLLALEAVVIGAELAKLIEFDQVDKIPDSYIAVLKESVDLVERDNLIEQFRESSSRMGENVKIERKYQSVFRGFAGEFSRKALNLLRSFSQVKYIEENQFVGIAQQNSITWGLDRSDQVNLPLDDFYSPKGTGKGVNVYVIDTGILPTHEEFEGRASIAFDALNENPSDPEYGIDCNGHGTHCAGTIGGKTWGVAKIVNLFGVRVFGCLGFGTNAGVLAGMEWVAMNAAYPAVASISHDGGISDTMDLAVEWLHQAGIIVVVAAGNSGEDACYSSPSRAPNAITVGATDDADEKASSSNFGTCLDIFAPGVSITSSWIDSDTDSNTISGTSMSCSHVTGAVAILKGLKPFMKPVDVAAELMNLATHGVVLNPGNGSPNYLLYI